MTIATAPLKELERVLENAPDRRVLWTPWEIAVRDEYDRRAA